MQAIEIAVIHGGPHRSPPTAAQNITIAGNRRCAPARTDLGLLTAPPR